jgi:heme/copper-type cytochrome/quinol oxidase subunit 2
VALPVDTRIQLLTVSKDIIHSWAIPSAGIKIDCVPGYSSHKITIFFLSGIYWGQCMEICGRYHHWMPIVVYFMKRDLFLLWCIHFVSSNKKNNSINSLSTVRNNNDNVYSVSYPTSSWIKELKK